MEKAYFAHPIDIHLTTQTIQGWPKIHLEIWHHDAYNRQEIYGYGTVFLPTCPGQHVVSFNWGFYNLYFCENSDFMG